VVHVLRYLAITDSNIYGIVRVIFLKSYKTKKLCVYEILREYYVESAGNRYYYTCIILFNAHHRIKTYGKSTELTVCSAIDRKQPGGRLRGMAQSFKFQFVDNCHVYYDLVHHITETEAGLGREP